MPKKVKELSALEVRRLDRVGMNAVGGATGLFLRIGLADSKSWVLRAMGPDGKRHDYGLGSFDKVSLAQAREATREAHALLAKGLDPSAERDRARAANGATVRRRGEPAAGVVTFKVAAEVYEIKRAEWSKVHAKNWWSSMERLVFPFIGNLPVADVSTDDVMRVLRPIWTTNTKTAVVVRARIELVLGWAVTAKHREPGLNPATWSNHLSLLLPKPSKIAKQQHFAAVSWKDAPAVFQALQAQPHSGALRFVIATACRSGEARGLVRSELDLDAKVWTLPESRAKARREFRCPLSTLAVSILEEGAEEGHVWLGPVSGRPITDIALGAPMRAIALDRDQATVHGWRSCFRDWVGATRRTDGDLAEIQLQHVEGNATTRAYYREDHLEERAELMETWAAYLTTPVKKVEAAS